MPKISSEIWKYFTKLNEKQVECKLCPKKLSQCGNTTNFWNHLLLHNIKKPVTVNQKEVTFQLN